ncbi:MAG TPA: ATP-binding protein [Chromatiaceae bacterium]|nr:ATP-binding protein [Chromatiaceae bacterium]
MKKSQVNLAHLRQRAELAIAQEASLATAGTSSRELDFHQLIEELRVYQAELEIQNEELALAQSETSLALERYRRLFDHLPLPALVVDNAGFIQELNHQACGQLGLSHHEAQNRGSLFQLFDLDSRAPLHRYFREPPQAEPRILPYLWVRWPGNPSYPCDLHLMPLNPASVERGQTLAVLVDRSDELALRDSEERWRELSRECQLAQQEAESANLAKSAFLAAMGHEFRTPMNSILGLTDLLLTREPTPGQADYLRKIHQAASALQGLLNGILDYARIETNLLAIESLPLRFKDLLTSTWHLFQQQAADKHLSLRFQVASDVPPLLSGDPLRVQQVINHLVDNALKFTAQGGVEVVISRADPPQAAETEVRLHLAVTDTGIGLTAEEQARIFIPFQQIDMSSRRAHGGLGLGLTLCQRLVTLMGGEIGVESVKGVGSTLWFTVPLGLPAQARVGEVAPPLPDPLPTPGGRKGHEKVGEDTDSIPTPVRVGKVTGAGAQPRSGTATGTSAQPRPGKDMGIGAQPNLDPGPEAQAGPDTGMIASHLFELAGLLANGSNRARQLNQVLLALVVGTSLEGAYAEIATAIRDLDYPQAQAALRDLANRQGWALP